ncbi:hypothetical protein GGI11_008183, partial [Coemansia sp. RSA 2049]
SRAHVQRSRVPSRHRGSGRTSGARVAGAVRPADQPRGVRQHGTWSQQQNRAAL